MYNLFFSDKVNKIVLYIILFKKHSVKNKIISLIFILLFYYLCLAIIIIIHLNLSYKEKLLNLLSIIIVNIVTNNWVQKKSSKLQIVYSFKF